MVPFQDAAAMAMTNLFGSASPYALLPRSALCDTLMQADIASNSNLRRFSRIGITDPFFQICSPFVCHGRGRLQVCLSRPTLSEERKKDTQLRHGFTAPPPTRGKADKGHAPATCSSRLAELEPCTAAIPRTFNTGAHTHTFDRFPNVIVICYRCSRVAFVPYHSLHVGHSSTSHLERPISIWSYSLYANPYHDMQSF